MTLHKKGRTQLIGFALFCFCITSLSHGSEHHWNEVFKTGLINAGGKEFNPQEKLNGKIVCLYFSAGWCGPCHRFTPSLKKFYEENKQFIEVIFISKDHDEKSFFQYMNKFSMDWLAVPWQSSKKSSNSHVSHLIQKYGGRGIPKLVVLSRDGKTILSPDGRRDLITLPEVRAEQFRKMDPAPYAAFERRQKIASGETVSETEHQQRLKELQSEYDKRALEYEAKYQGSLKPPPLEMNPQWSTLLYHHYSNLRKNQTKK